MLDYRRSLSAQETRDPYAQPVPSRPLTVFELDDNGRLAPHNLHALRFLGYQPSEDQPPSLAELVSPEERQQALAAMHAWQKGVKLPPVPHRLTRKDGSTLETCLLGQRCLRAGRPVALTVRVFAA